MDFGAMMREQLRANGWTLRAACKAMSRDQAYPSRVMNGHEPPSQELARDLDRLCRTTKFTKAYRALKRARTAAETAPPGGRVDPMLRREILRLAGASAVSALAWGSAPAQPSGATELQVTDHKAIGTHLWRLYGRLEAKSEILPSVAEHLQGLQETISAGAHQESMRLLCSLNSEALQLAGEVFFDGGAYDDAVNVHLLAASAAKEADEYDRWACALTRYALVLNTEKRWKDSRNLLEAAEQVALRGDSQLPTRQWVASVQAEVAAATGERSEVERALDRASTVLDLTAPVGNGGWLRFTGDRLPEQRASAYLSLGLYDRAEQELSIALSASLTPRRSAAILIDRARLALHQRAPETAREHVEAAAEIAARTGSTYVAGKLAQLHAELIAADDPSTVELTEALSEATKGNS
jgi:tetratricopeptide (TPR) repeat protein